MAKPWDEHRETITRLYIQEGRTLEDVRGIMKNEYDFKASTRSYRQHFDIWQVGKYNCKKRQERRRNQTLKRTILPSPLRSPPGLTSSSETNSDPASSPTSSCGSHQLQRSPEQQLPLPALQHPPRYPSYLNAHQLPPTVAQTEPRIKTESGGPTSWSIKAENGGGPTSWRDVPMYQPPSHPPQSVLQSNVHFTYAADSANWTVHHRPPPPPPPSPPSLLPPSSFLSSHSSHEYCRPSYRCVPETASFPRHGEMGSGLRAPNLSIVRGNGGHGALHPPLVSVPVSFHHQGVASG